MLIEWSPHCHAQGVSLLTPFLSQSSTLTRPPLSLLSASHTSPLENLRRWRSLFPPTALRKLALFEVHGGDPERV